jgi:tubulin polyglutamylase TTLL6/13
LTRNPELLTAEKVIIKNEFGKEEGMVVQRYMAKPFLIDGFKFLIVGINPLRLYLYKDGLARFATVKYQTPNNKNLDNMCMHLTNYAINKESDDFIPNNDEERDDIGSKRSFAFVLQYVTDHFGKESRDLLVSQIKDILIKTLCMA